MPLETFTFITSLNQNWPVGTDLLSQSDDHHRGIKKAVQDSFPNINAAVTCSPADLNQFTGTAAGGSGIAVTGMISMFAGTVAPNAWLLCDGAVIDGAHTALIALVGANTPDLQGQFVRGWSPDAVVDPDGPRAPLSTQAEDLKSHQHSLDRFASGAAGASYVQTDNDDSESPESLDTPTGLTGGDETRPVNMALSYIIKI